MEEIICNIQIGAGSIQYRDILASIPGVFLGLFSIYFAYQKIGDKVTVSYSVGCGGTSAESIVDVLLVNMKNKPITIYSMYAVIDYDVVIELETFEPPRLLKPLESMKVYPPPYTSLKIGPDDYDPDYTGTDNIEIYIISDKKKIKCKTINSPSIVESINLDSYRRANKKTCTFNGKVYNDIVKYAIVYNYESEINTAFVLKSGAISEDWNFKYIRFPNEFMETEEKVKEYLVSKGFDKVVESFFVHKVGDKR